MRKQIKKNEAGVFVIENTTEKVFDIKALRMLKAAYKSKVKDLKGMLSEINAQILEVKAVASSKELIEMGISDEDTDIEDAEASKVQNLSRKPKSRKKK
jgi:hypothetical protein